LPTQKIIAEKYNFITLEIETYEHYFHPCSGQVSEYTQFTLSKFRSIFKALIHNFDYDFTKLSRFCKLLEVTVSTNVNFFNKNIWNCTLFWETKIPEHGLLRNKKKIFFIQSQNLLVNLTNILWILEACSPPIRSNSTIVKSKFSSSPMNSSIVAFAALQYGQYDLEKIAI